jgi:hypothetical protein
VTFCCALNNTGHIFKESLSKQNYGKIRSTKLCGAPFCNGDVAGPIKITKKNSISNNKKLHIFGTSNEK